MSVDAIILANFPRNLKYLRLSKNPPISQEALARILKTTQNSISSYETGTNLPPASFLLQLSWYAHVSVDDLLSKDLRKKGL